MLRSLRYLVVCLALLGLASCSKEEEPIKVAEGAVTVANTTDTDWSEVLITVNDHYRGYFPALKAQGRANAPLSNFDTGFGQRWTQGAQVRKVVVTAKGADGKPVELLWEIGQKKAR